MKRHSRPHHSIILCTSKKLLRRGSRASSPLHDSGNSRILLQSSNTIITIKRSIDQSSFGTIIKTDLIGNISQPTWLGIIQRHNRSRMPVSCVIRHDTISNAKSIVLLRQRRRHTVVALFFHGMMARGGSVVRRGFSSLESTALFELEAAPTGTRLVGFYFLCHGLRYYGKIEQDNVYYYTTIA